MTNRNREYQICLNCVMDTSDPEIVFDKNGRCDYCSNYYSKLLPTWESKKKEQGKLFELVEKIKNSRNNNKYDCIIGVSGGVDSSYLLYYVKEVLSLNPLAYTVDTGWNLEVASGNIAKIVKTLGIDLFTEVINWQEMKDLQRAFLLSNVPYQDIPQDHVIFAGLYNYAMKNGLRYVLTGANYATEGVKPPYEWTYFNDIALIRDIHKKFGKIDLKTLPLCGMLKNRIHYRFIRGMKVIHPLNYIDYKSEEATNILEGKFGWEKYKNKHYENIFTRFYEGYYLPKKFGYDKRRCYLSNLILTGQMNRSDALAVLSQSPYDETVIKEDMGYIAKKLDFSLNDLSDLVEGEKRTYRDYRSNALILKSAIRAAVFLGREKRLFR